MLLWYVLYTLALVLFSFLVFRVVVRRDYRKRGRLGLVSTTLETLIWLPFFTFPYIFKLPARSDFWKLDSIGSVLIVIGIVSVIVIMGSLGFSRSFGQQVNTLRSRGPYKVTRNPQIITGSLIVFGTVLCWPSWYGLGWILLYGVMAHVMVITEEEHLRDVFGEGYLEYCRQVPRYLRLKNR
ncbi:MAG: methyltransferase [bacterium]